LKKDFLKLKQDIKTSIISSLQNKEPMENMTNKIRDLLYKKYGNTTFGNIYKSVRVMRTETTRMRTQLKNDICNELKKQGIPIKRRWVYTWESKVPRPSHVLMDGVYEDNQGMFTVDGYRTIGPGLFHVASEDINCSCDTEICLQE